MAIDPQWCWSWGQFAGWHTCWHDDESGSYTAVDFNYGDGNEDAGQVVELWFDGSPQHVSFFSLSNTYCTGVRAAFYASSGQMLYGGDVHYLHISLAEGVIGSSIVFSGWAGDAYYYYRGLGWVAAEQPSGCSFDGAHLHQSADNSASSSFWTNKFANPTSGWVHEVCWTSQSTCP